MAWQNSTPALSGHPRPSTAQAELTVSTPSTTTSMFSSRARLRAALTIASFPGSMPMSAMNVWAILIRSTGYRRK